MLAFRCSVNSRLEAMDVGFLAAFVGPVAGTAAAAAAMAYAVRLGDSLGAFAYWGVGFALQTLVLLVLLTASLLIGPEGSDAAWAVAWLIWSLIAVLSAWFLHVGACVFVDEPVRRAALPIAIIPVLLGALSLFGLPVASETLHALPSLSVAFLLILGGHALLDGGTAGAGIGRRVASLGFIVWGCGQGVLSWLYAPIENIALPYAFSGAASSFLGVWLLFLGLMRREADARDALKRAGQTEQRLRESEERLGDLVDAASDWFWEMDAELRFTYLSNQLANFVRVDPKRVIGRKRHEVVGEPLEPGAMERHLEDLEDRRSFRDFQYSIVDDHGKVHYVKISGKPIYDRNGRFQGYRGTGSDITAQVLAEQKAREQADSLRVTLENMDVGVSVISPTLEHMAFNPRYIELLELPAEQFGPGTSLADTFRYRAKRGDYGDVDVETYVTAKMEQARRGERVRLQRTLPSGRTLDISARPLMQGGWVTTYVDITDRVRAEALATRLGRALENSAQEIYLFDATTLRFTQVNRGACDNLGYTKEELLAMTPVDIAPGFSETRLRDLLRPLVNGEEDLIVHEASLRRKNGSIYIAEARIELAQEERPPVFYAVVQDVTQRRVIEKALKEAKEAAELSSRTKSEFLANMSHELRTPLNAIIGFSEIIHSEMFGTLSNERYRTYAADIRDSGNHLLMLINDILDMSKAEAGRLVLRESEVRIPDVIAAAVRLVRVRAQDEGIEIIVKVPDALPMILGDEQRLKQIVLNLLTNAVKFTFAGGRVTVSAEINDRIGLILSISDTGIGMAEDDVPRALQAFTQIDSALSRKYDGTGLGLPLSKSMVELHGGTLEIASEVGLGTTVTVILPRDRILHSTRHGSSGLAAVID